MEKTEILPCKKTCGYVWKRRLISGAKEISTGYQRVINRLSVESVGKMCHPDIFFVISRTRVSKTGSPPIRDSIFLIE